MRRRPPTLSLLQGHGDKNKFVNVAWLPGSYFASNRSRSLVPATTRRTAIGCVLLLFTTACHSPEARRQGPIAKEIAYCYKEAIPMVPRPDLQDMQTAMRVQSEYVHLLSKSPLDYVGYKVALTSNQAQRKFSYDAPIRGRLLSTMLLENHAQISARSGARLMLEGDLLVRVSSSLIQAAESTTEVATYIDAVIPFIEVPDLMYPEGSVLSGPDLAAINAGARFGVMGTPVTVQHPTLWVSRLAGIKVTLRDAHGQEVATGYGRDLLTHPLKALLWVRDSLKADGQRLRAGDLVSLGSMTKLLPVVPGTTMTATYEHLDPSGPVTVTVYVVE